MKKLIFAIVCTAALAVRSEAQALDSYNLPSAQNCNGTDPNTGYWHAELVPKSRMVGGVLVDAWWACDPAGHYGPLNGIYVVDPTSAVNANDNNAKTPGVYSQALYGDAPNNYHWAADILWEMASWHNTVVGPYFSAYVTPTTQETDSHWPLDAQGNRTVPGKMAAMYIVRPDLYPMSNNSTGPDNNGHTGTWHYLTGLTAVKDLTNSYSPLYPATPSSLGVPDHFDPGIVTWLSSTFASADPTYTPFTTGSAGSQAFYKNFRIMACCDSDQERNMAGAGDALFASVPAGNNPAHIGWIIATMSPYQSYGTSKNLMYSTSDAYPANLRVYDKAEWQSEMQAEYGTIGALNTAYGSNYTTFGSSGTVVTGETLFTANGTAGPFSFTLAHANPDTYSFELTRDDGTPIAGGYEKTWTNTLNQCIKGPLVNAPTTACATDGSFLTKSTGAGQVTFSGQLSASGFAFGFTCSSVSGNGTITLPFNHPQYGWKVGDSLTVSGTVDLNGSYAITGFGTGTANLLDKSYTVNVSGCAASATDNPTTGQIAWTPATGSVFKANYIFGGWGSGSGLMDEDGRNTWFGGPAPTLDIIKNLTGLPSALKTDLNNLRHNAAVKIYGSAHDAVKAWDAHAMFIAGETLSQHSLPPPADVITAICSGGAGGAPISDAVLHSGPQMWTQAMEDYWDANCPGDKVPHIWVEIGSMSGSGSVMSAQISSLTRSANVVTVVTASPHANLSLPSLSGKSVDVAGCGAGFDGGPYTVNAGGITSTGFTYNQTAANGSCTSGTIYIDCTTIGCPTGMAAAGALYAANASALWTMKNSTTGKYDWMGHLWLQLFGIQGEPHVYGLLSYRGNKMDGVQNQPATFQWTALDPITGNLTTWQRGGEDVVGQGDFFDNGYMLWNYNFQFNTPRVAPAQGAAF